MSKQETNGDSAVEILINEPYEDPELGKGQYTHKVIHLGSKMPGILRAICPTSLSRVEEKAWNSYPYCRTVYSNAFFGNRFGLTLETWHKDHDLDLENVHELSDELLAQRQVVYVDIVNDPFDVNEHEEKYDPSAIQSKKSDRAPLKDKNWQKSAKPIMCCYKLATIKFKVFGFETKIESLIANGQASWLRKFHRLLFSLIDDWLGLTMDDIRRIEEETKLECEEKVAFHAQSKSSAIKAPPPSIVVDNVSCSEMVPMH